MKRNGFTLAEILAVIIILGVIVLIAIPNVDDILDKGKQKSYDLQIKLIEDSLKNWAADNVFKLPSEDGKYIVMTLGELKRAGFIDVEVRNPDTNECFSNDTELKITRYSNNLKYEVVESTLSFYEADSCGL